MELNQISYFINLAETLNFTAAARLSGVSQPSLTRAIRRLEEELGGPLIYRDGKNSRLTSLGQDVETEFWVQRVVADGLAICILPERSVAAPGLVTRPIEGLSLEREIVIATVLGSTTPVEIRKIAQLASRYEWK
jgi:DNA-binding transcriptional LysR family regulator